MKLNVKAFALACGLIWGVGLLGLTWWLIMLEGATGEKLGIGRFYIGYNVSALGSVIGMVGASLTRLSAGRYLRGCIIC